MGAEGETNRSDDDVKVELLRDIFKLVPNDISFISTEDLRSEFHTLEERPWGTWSHGHPMTARALAGRLKPFGIYPRSNGAVRGYDRDRFLDVWSRYKIGPSPSPPNKASNRQAPNEVEAGVVDALTVHAGDRGPLGEWTLAEIDAMEKAGQLLRTDLVDRLQRLSDTAKLNSGD